jgi:hypothetical protein
MWIFLHLVEKKVYYYYSSNMAKTQEHIKTTNKPCVYVSARLSEPGPFCPIDITIGSQEQCGKE